MDVTGACSRMEEESIEMFTKMAESEGWAVTKSTLQQDLEEHWDLKLSKPYAECRVDVKGAKKINRDDRDSDDSLILVEYTGNKGHPGWLRGKADCIAFQVNEGFLLTNREELLAHTWKVVNWCRPPECSRTDKVKHVVYQRSYYGNEDLIVYLTKEEVKRLSFLWRWEKIRS